MARISYYLTYFSQEYYFITFFLVSSYGFLRDSFRQHYNPTYSRFVPPDELWSWERNILGTFVTYAAVKYFRRRSVEGFIGELCFYAKVCLVFMAFMLDLRAFYIYVLCCYASFLLFPQPGYSGPEKLVVFTPYNFQETVLDAEKNVTWLVAFVTSWSTDCIHLSSVLANVSNRFTTEKLRFGTLDVGAWPHVARAWGVDCSSISNQLPTLLLFEKGAMHSRCPAQETALNPMQRSNIKQADIIRLFELDRRYASSMVAPATTTSKDTKQRSSKAQ